MLIFFCLRPVPCAQCYLSLDCPVLIASLFTVPILFIVFMYVGLIYILQLVIMSEPNAR
jgi:hypothetical protein